MAELKTKINDASVAAYLDAIADEKKRKGGFILLELLQKVTGFEPQMWGTSIIGYGSYHYKYASGHEGDAPLVGFSPRKQNFSIYLMCGLQGQEALLNKLGKHKMGKGCLYINNMEDVDQTVLEELIKNSMEAIQKTVKKREGE